MHKDFKYLNLEQAKHHLSFTFPKPPNKANSRNHHLVMYKNMNAYYQLCDLTGQTIECRLKPKQRKIFPLKKVLWTAHFKLKAFYDCDNLMALCKWPIDYLVNSKIIADDNYKVAWAKDVPTQDKVEKGQLPSVTIKLWGFD